MLQQAQRKGKKKLNLRGFFTRGFEQFPTITVELKALQSKSFSG